MTRFNTGNNLNSLDERDFYDNCLSLDQAMNSTEPTWRDRFNVEKPTIDAALKSAGFMPAGFDFVTGGTLQPGDRNKCVFNPAPNGDNNWYRWNGAFPKEIAANSQPNPKDENNWVPVSLFNTQSKFFQLTLEKAKKKNDWVENDRCLITDTGFIHEFKSTRELVKGVQEFTLQSGDELHIFVDSGGMLEFIDYEKIKSLETSNYAKYLAKTKTTTPIKLKSYGDSITFGMMQGGGQYQNHYPKVLCQVMTELTRNNWSCENLAFSGDRISTNYIRTMSSGGAGDISTIMLGVNDALFATNNGENSNGLLPGGIYSTENYSLILRKFIARELVKGSCVVLFSGTQFISHNTGPSGILSAGYFARAYDNVLFSLAKEFGCGFIDVKRDITQQYGISDSTHDGIHLSSDFLNIFGRRLAGFFLQQDFKNPCVINPGKTFIPNLLHNPVSSNKPINGSSLFVNGSSPGLLGGVDNPESVGIRLPNDGMDGNVTLAFYLDGDNTVIFPSINTDGGQWNFDLILDNGAKQAPFPYNFNLLSTGPEITTSGKSIIGNKKRNRTTEKYSWTRDMCYLHITNRGWHYISFHMRNNTGNVNVEGLVSESWESISENDVYGGISGIGVYEAGDDIVSGFITAITRQSTGIFNVSINDLVPERYRIEIEKPSNYPIDLYQIRSKTNSSFIVEFIQGNGFGAGVNFNLYNPPKFTVRVLGGK